MIPSLVLSSFLLSFAITPAFTATFTSIRIPLSITPIKDIPRPENKDAEVALPDNVELFSKATLYDDLTLSTIYDLDRILTSTMSSVISNVFVLEERGLLDIALLSAYNCTTWCFDLQTSEITRVTGKTMENLKGEPNSITVLALHNAIVQTLEDIYCFNMTVIEERVGMSSKIVLEHQWALFVPEIVKEAVQCKADILGVTVSELAELLRTNVATLYGYTLDGLTNTFFPNFLLLQARKNVFESRPLVTAYAFAGLTEAQGQAETMLSFASHSSIAFNLRDLEILYDWQKPQLFAIENVPLSSYLGHCSVVTANTLLAVSTVLFGQGATEPSCNVAYVLSRSLNEVEAKYAAVTTVENRNSLNIFITATGISSWFDMDSILQTDIDEGIWVEIPSVSHVASAASQTTQFIKTCSLPAVIASLKNANVSGTLGPFLEINNPTFRSLLLTTYGYSTNELISLTGKTLAQLFGLSVVELHAIILDALVERYSISNLHVFFGEADVDMRVLSTLPSFEWSRIVRAVIQGSFVHAADAVSVNVAAQGSHLVVTNQADGNPSIQISPTTVFFSPKISTSQLATCLLGQSEANIYDLSSTAYHQLYSGSIVPIVNGKITIESSPLESLLANDGLVLQQIWNRTVAAVIAEYTGLSVQQLGCLYGWNQGFLGLIDEITWGNVSAYRLCSDYETSTLHQILVLLSTAQPKNCFGTISLTQSAYNVDESAGIVVVFVELIGGEVDSVVDVKLSLFPLTATLGTDFENKTDVTVTFQVNEIGSKPVIIDIPDDGIAENDEQFLVVIQSLNADTRVLTSSATVTIIDDDFVSISWQVPDNTVNEDVVRITPNLVLNGDIEKNIIVSVVVNDLSTSAADYSLLTPTVIFTPSDVSKTKAVTILITDDFIVEGPESLALSLSTTDTLVNTSSTVILIQDNDRITVSFVQGAYSFNEATQTYQVVVIATALSQLAIPVQIGYSTLNSDASAALDYVNQNTVFTFSPFTGSQTNSISIQILGDDLVENDETFTVELSVPAQSASLATLGNPQETTVTIVDDDTAELNFNSPSYVVNEGTTSFVDVIVILTGDIQRSVEIGYSTLPGTASTNDFSDTTGSITFNPGESVGTIRIPIANDGFVEAAEQFRVILLLRDAKTTIGSFGETTVTITDDDKATVQFIQASYTFDEDVGTALLGVRLLNLAGPLQTDVNVSVTAAGTTATANSDFTAPSSILTFYAGDFQEIRNISLPINDDNLFEIDETLLVVLTPASDQKVLVTTPQSATVTITNNDVALISFSQNSYSVIEGNPVSVSVEVVAGTLGSNIDVSLTTQVITAGNSDFVSATISVQFQAGETGPKIVNFVTNPDEIVESTELFSVSLATSSGVSLGSSATVSISDDDDVIVQFTTSLTQVTEGSPTVTVTISAIGTKTIPIVVSVRTQGQSATEIADYVQKTESVTFQPNDVLKDVQISIRDDDRIEEEESFQVLLTAVSSQVTLGPNSINTVQIIDDDFATVQFTSELFFGNETFGYVDIWVILTGILEDPVSISVSTDQDTALAGIDYGSLTNYPLVFTPGGSTLQYIRVNITDDLLIEGTERFTASISSDSLFTRIGSINETTVRIIDNDVASLGFSNAVNLAVAEGSSALLTVEVTGPLTTQVSATATVSLLSASNADFNVLSATNFDFSPGNTNAQIFITTDNDNIIEGDEVFIVTLSTTSSSVRIDERITTVTIQDNDDAFISLSLGSYQGSEDSPVVEISIDLVGTLETVIQGRLVLSPNSAISADYVVLDDPIVTFTSSSSTTQKRNITIVDDDVVESLEVFTVSLQAVSGNVQITPRASASILISDNDAAIIGFSPTTEAVLESAQNVNLTVQLFTSAPLQRTVPFRYSTINNTARSPGDYDEITDGQLQFNIGEDNGAVRVISIGINDDVVTESAENFQVQLSANSDSTVGSSRTATVTIIDNDVPSIRLIESTTSVDEGAGQVTVQALLIGIVDREVTARLRSSDTTAFQTLDYQPIDQAITFPVGDPLIQVTVDIDQDILIEGDETFEVTLTSTDANVQDPQSLTVTIDDDDTLTIGFQTSTLSVPENQAVATIPIILTGVRAVPVTFSLTAAGVSATNGGDFTFNQQDITVNPSDPSTRIVTIPITPDLIVEGNEIFNLFITETSDLIVVNTPALAVTIVDDDSANIRFSQGTYSFPENIGLATVQVEVDGDLETTVIARVTSSTNTAESGVDFTSISNQAVTFSPGETSKPVNIIIISDDIVEADEIFTLTLSTGGSAQLDLGTPANTFITIVDDDDATVEMSAPTYTYSEEIVTARVDAKLNTLLAIARPLQFRIFTENGTAYSPRDFTHLNQLGEFGSGFGNGATVSFTIDISDDSVVENTEHFFVQLAEVDPALKLVNLNRSTVFIQDNDAFEARFVNGDRSVNEEDNSVGVSVQLIGEHERAVTIRLVTTPVSATAGSDYQPQVVDLLFSPGESLKAVDITILDDLVIEGTEQFQVTISTGDAQVRILDPPTIVVSIIDTDVATVSFNQTEYRVSEDVGSSAIWVELKNDLQINSEVNVQVYNFPDTAQSPADYTFTGLSIILTFRGGETKLLPIYFNVVDDDNVEDEESFYGLINAPAGGTVRAEEPLIVKVYIEDNDVALVGFTQASYNVDEGNNAVVTIQLDNSLAISVTVSVKTTAVSATSNTDFAGITRQDITFNAGETTKQVSISTVPDLVVEDNEIFRVSLETTHLRVRFSRDEATVTIDDDDAVIIAFQQPQYIVFEDDGTFEITYPISGSTSIPLNYVVHIDPGSAGLTSDYLGTSQSLTILPGTTQNTVTVQLVNDQNIETNETFSLRMDNLNNDRIILGNPSTTTVLILDDDAATVEFAQPQYNVLEDGGTVTVTLNLTGILDQNTTVRVSSYDVTALAGADYTEISSQEVKFTPGGPTEYDIVIPIDDDGLHEGTESFVLRVSSQNANTRIGENANTTVRIIDDDVVSVDFVQPTASVLEQSGITVVGIEISGTHTRPVTVSVESVNINALAGSDYTQVTTSVTFQPSESIKQINVFITRDDLIENNEQFRLRLSTDDSQVITNDDEMIITITDDDNAAIRFEQSTYTFNEDDGIVTLGILLTGNLAITVSATVQFSPQTAAVSDYTPPQTTTVVFLPGSNRAVITVQIINDDIVEAMESFLAELQPPSSKVTLASPDETTVFIRDDDAAQVRFITNTQNVNEDIGVMNMSIVLTTVNPLQREVSVRFSTVEDTAKPPGDYSSVTGSTVTFNVGDTNGATRQGMVSINDDQIVEATETFSVVLTEIDSGLTPTTFSSATISIIDDDSATLAFAQLTYSVNEQDTSVDLLVLLTGTITRTVTARISTGNIDAIAGNDYARILNQQITFSPGDPTIQTVPVTISDDDIVENNERFTAMLSAENGVIIRPDAQTTTVTIIDNDEVTVTLEGSQVNVIEGNTNAVVFVKVVGSTTRERDIHVNVSTYDVSALATLDYTAKTELVTLDTSNLQIPFLALILEDSIVENTEQFGIRITSTDPQVNVQNGNLLISIRDNDQITLSMGEPAYTVQENGGAVLVEVVVSGETTVDIAGSSLSTQALTAQTPADFAAIQRTILVQPGSTSFTISIPIQDDGIIELAESFQALLSTTNSAQVIIGNPSSSSVTIIDNDGLDISFEQPLYIVSEDDGTITVGVIVTGSTAIADLDFSVTAQDGSATLTADYVLLTTSVDLTPGVSRHEISVRIEDNVNLENNETFSLHLNNGGDTRVRVVGLDETTILILDDDAATIQFTRNLYSFDEFNNTAHVTLSITGVLGGPATVRVFSRDNSAIAGLDYDRVNGVQVTFVPNGPTTQALSIDITDDVSLEGAESFHLDLVSSINNIQIGAIGTTMIRIIDDDSVSVEFVQTTASVVESGGLVQVQVEITGQRSLPVTARVESNNLLATVGQDYVEFDQTITFQPSDSQPQTLNVFITPDNKIEADETFVLILSTNTNGVTLGDRTMTITIQDDDVATIRFEQPQYQVNESVSSFRIPVLLEGDASIAIDATVALSPETAIQGDYVLVSGAVTFSPGVQEREIVVFISDDDIVERTETFKATLSAVGTKAVVGSPDETRIFVQDNDVAQVRFQTNAYSVNEVDQIVNLTVVLVTIEPLGRDAPISISTQDGSAASANNVDYDSLVSSLITFRQGDANGATQWISIPVIDDSRTELSETFTATLSTVNTGGLVPANPFVTTVTIVDNDNAQILFAPTTYTVVESTRTITLNIIRIGIIERPVSAFLTLQAGTATTNNDFTDNPTAITFNVLDTSKSVVISITNDEITEGTESFTARLTGTNGAVVPDHGDTATVTIIDDDVLTIVLEADPSAVPESAGTITVTVKAIGGLQRAINLNVFTFDISASTGDYVSKNEVITLDSTNPERNFVVSISNDLIVENTEIFGVNVTTDESQVFIQDETITLTILDDDRLTLSISQASYAVQEDTPGFVSVDVTVSGTTSVLVSGSLLSTSDGTAIQPQDYQSIARNLIIVPGDVNKNVIISVINDGLTEGDENFILALTTTNTNQVNIARDSALVIIQDDDVATVQFQSNQYSVNESANEVQVIVILTGTLGQTLQVSLNTAQDSATAGLDYDQVNNRVLTFSPGDSVMFVPITIRNDILIEGSEDFTATLSLSSPLANIGTIGTTTVTILDDDVAGVGFSLSSLVVEEDEGTVQIAVDSTGNLNTPVTVSVTVTRTTASANDYTVADDISLTFTPNGATRQFFSFTPVDDDRVENDEIVLATLSTADVHAEILTRVTQITIQDNDKAIVRLGQTSVTKSEGDGFASINVLLTGNLDVSVTVSLGTQPVTAVAGSDYITSNQQVVFQPGDSEETRQVIIIDDLVVESVEVMNVVLTSTDGKVIVGSPSTTNVIINDNDEASLYFSATNYFASETDERAVLTVVLATNAPLQRSVTASFILADGTAVSPEDFPDSITATVTFNAGDDNLATRTVTIPVVDDDIVEPTQNFQVTIDSSDNVVTPGTATVHISDNDVVSVRFTESAYYFDEDEAVTNVKVDILFSSPLQKSINIGVTSQDNSATANQDYTPLIANNVIVISPADGAEKLVPVSILNDVLFEDVENFRLTLSSVDPSVTVNSPSETNVFINDDDDAVVGFQRNVYWTNEDSGSVQICVVTSTVLRDDIVVTVSTTTFGTASPGLDYEPVNQQLNLTSTTPVCINVVLLEDLLIEGNETFSLQLGTLNSRVQIPLRFTTVHIIDDDVNECTDQTHDCHANAFCSDTDDSFTCTCNPGYEGNGRVCTDIDECARNTHNCHNNATCSNTIGSFDCTCNPGYTGDGINNCVDLIECDPNPNSYPCHRFSTCIDTMGSYVCFCPVGFVGDGYNFCNDTNECQLGTHDCVSFAACQNNRGSYTCQCPSGFFGDGRNCVDIRECETGSDNCHDDATCTNTVGSYDCTCNLGFTGNGRVCDDIDECENMPCDANANCSNMVGSYECVCRNGFTGNGLACQNIDECANNPCVANARCEDSPGTYDCICNDGFTGDGHNFCTDDDECALETDNCHVNASCHDTDGSFECRCLPGFTGNGVSCQNINECLDSPCHPFATCHDTLGSFTCKCPDGFVGNGTYCADKINCIPTSFDWPCHQTATCEDIPVGSFTCACRSGYTGNGFICDDIDECTQGTHNCGVNATCENVPGTYTCDCSDGFIADGPRCIDFNECQGPNPCNASTSDCVNFEGGHNCICKTGFQQDASDQNCYDTNECNGVNQCDANADCHNTFGSYGCTCRSGFTGNGFSCLDIHECNDLDPCHANADCRNDIGGFTCTCKVGFSGDGINNCEDIDECPEGCHALASCQNNPGSFTCDCNTGYSGDGISTCNDINECDDDPNRCPGGTCTNSVGSFSCTCGEGYNLQGSVCVDVDECLQAGICPDNSQCRNHPGLFNCECNTGYGGPTCTDIDECDIETDECSDQANCTNTVGSYTCQCLQGYSGDGRTCDDINECQMPGGTHNCDGNATCVNEPSTFSCRCNQGYNGDGEHCEDIKECQDADAHDCSSNALCIEVAGTFDCVCKTGFTGNGRMCEDIRECNTNPCHANAECTELQGTFQCDCRSGFTGTGLVCTDIRECDTNLCHPNANCTELPGTFQCICKTGYSGTGLRCEDIDECLQSGICDSNANCLNTDGSFTCTCRSGFTGDGQSCQDITECAANNPCHPDASCTEEIGSFSCACNTGYTGNGTYCQNINECDEQGPCHSNATCDDTPGSYTCTCNDGFTGSGKICADVEECSAVNYPCHANATCTELPGSFSCACSPGYTGNGTYCQDIDECQLNLCDANAACNDILGSYTCTCHSGYSGDGLTCTDINECTENTHNCANTNSQCINRPGSFECNCNSGFTGSGIICTDIDECAMGSDNCHKNADCVNTDGSFTCTCKKGFTGTGASCADINECNQTPSPCLVKDTTCENLYGSHRCICPRGQNYVPPGSGLCEDVLIFNLQFVIQNVTFSNALLDATTEAQLELKAQLENSVNYVYNKSDIASHYIEPAHLQSFSQGPENTVRANFTIFISNTVRDMSMTNVKTNFDSNLTPGNGGMQVLEPSFLLSDISAGDDDECSWSPSVCDPDELCQNYPGTYRCYCSSPAQLNIDNVCTNVITFQSGVLILNRIFVDELKNANSLLFLQLAEDLQNQLNRIFKSIYGDSFQGTQVIAMNPGSVNVSFLIFFNPGTNTTKDGKSLAQLLRDNLDPGNMLGSFVIDPAEVEPTADYNECGPSSVVHIPDCDRNANCTNVVSTYECTCKEGYYGDGSTCSAIPNMQDPDPPKDDLWWLVYAIVFGIAFLVICMFILFVCCLENAEENRYMVENNTTLVNDRNKYFFHNESVGIVNPDIELASRTNGGMTKDIYTTSPVPSRMESYKVNPMFHETRSQTEQSSMAERSSISNGQEGYVAL